MPVTANISISFGEGGSGSDGHLSAEIDGRLNGLNAAYIDVNENGDASAPSFAPGDVAGFLVYKSSNVTYDTPVASTGTIAAAGTGILVEKEDDIQFANTNKGSLSIPAEAITSVTWMGRSLGSLTMKSPTEVEASAKGVAVARVKYTCRADGWKLTSPATVAELTDFSILVFILGHIAGESES